MQLTMYIYFYFLLITLHISFQWIINKVNNLQLYYSNKILLINSQIHMRINFIPSGSFHLSGSYGSPQPSCIDILDYPLHHNFFFQCPLYFKAAIFKVLPAFSLLNSILAFLILISISFFCSSKSLNCSSNISILLIFCLLLVFYYIPQEHTKIRYMN